MKVKLKTKQEIIAEARRIKKDYPAQWDREKGLFAWLFNVHEDDLKSILSTLPEG